MKKAPGKPPPKSPAGLAEAPVLRRRYDSQLRQQQAAQTRERIIAAGSQIAHRLTAWDWSEMTFKAVGESAGVSERTVHRYFSSVRKLRDAILQRLMAESGISLEGLELGDFAGVAARAYKYLSSFAVSPPSATEPSFVALDLHRREVLLTAVARSTDGWSKGEREIAAAVLDLLWNPSAYERLSTAWHLDIQRATKAITWVVSLVENAIQQGHRPGGRGK